MPRGGRGSTKKTEKDAAEHPVTLHEKTEVGKEESSVVSPSGTGVSTWGSFDGQTSGASVSSGQPSVSSVEEMEASGGGGGGSDTDQKKKQGKIHAFRKKVIKPLFGKSSSNSHPSNETIQEYPQSQDMAEDEDNERVTGEQIDAKINQSRETEVKKTVEATVRAKYEEEMKRWKEAELKKMETLVKEETEEKMKEKEKKMKEKEEEMKEKVEAEMKRKMEAEMKKKMKEMESEMKVKVLGEMEEKERILKTQADSEIQRVKRNTEIIQSSVAKDILTKDQEITRLQAENKQMKEDTESLDNARQEVAILRSEVKKKKDELAKQLKDREVEIQRKREELEEKHMRELEKEQQQNEQVRGKLEEEEKKIAEIQQRIKELEGERDEVRKELEKQQQQVKVTNEELENKCLMLQEVCEREKEMKQEFVQEKEELLREKQEIERKLKNEMEVKVHDLEARGVEGHLETDGEAANLDHRHHLEPQITLDDIPSNVYHFSHQLSKLVDPEGDSCSTKPRPLNTDVALRTLKTLGIDPGFKPRGYVLAVFHSYNQNQSLVLDYTCIGEMQAKDHEIYLPVSGGVPDEEERSPLSSLGEVKLEVTEGNITDAHKLELQPMLIESQKQLELLQTENKQLLARLKILEEQDVNAVGKEELQKTAVQEQSDRQERKSKPVDLLEAHKRLKSKFLKLHEEKMELLEKLEERDTQVKTLRDKVSQVTVEYPTVEHSLSAGELQSPDDPKAEIYQLKKVIEDKEKKIDNLTVQLQSFEKVASGNTDLGQQVVKLKEQLKAAQAKIEQLRNDSELAHACESLRSEVVTLRKQLKDVEKDHGTEKDVLEKELEAEMQNQSQLKAEVDKLEAALRSLQSRHSSVDVEFIAMNDSAMDQSREDAEFITGLHQDEVEELKGKLGRRNSSIKNLHTHRKSLEGQLLALKEDRDRLAQQNVELFAKMSNFKGKLYQCDTNAEEYAQQSEKQMFELQSLRSEKEALMKQMQCLNDEVVAWKFEATINKEDFEHERRDRENMASHMSDEFGRWSVKEQEYQGIIGGLENELKHVKHEVEQQLYTLNVQLEQKEAQFEKFKENQITQQKELDEIRDNLREERDTIKTELFHLTEKYQSLKEEKNHDSESLQEKLDLLQVQNNSLEECVINLKEEAQKLHEVNASEKHNLKQELNETIEKYKKERDALLSQHRALEVQRQIDHAQWMEDREKLEGTIADTSRMTDEILSKTQQVKQYKKQADSLQDQLKKVKQELEGQQAYFQEMLLKKDVEHKEEIALQAAQFNSEKMDLERVYMPTRRELEQLRKQRMSETQFAETFRNVEEEKRQVTKELNELKRKLRTLEEDYLLARDVLIKNSIPLPQRTYQNDGQIKMETMPQTSTSASYDIQPYIENKPSHAYTTAGFHHLDDYPRRQMALSKPQTQHGCYTADVNIGQIGVSNYHRGLSSVPIEEQSAIHAGAYLSGQGVMGYQEPRLHPDHYGGVHPSQGGRGVGRMEGQYLKKPSPSSMQQVMQAQQSRGRGQSSQYNPPLGQPYIKPCPQQTNQPTPLPQQQVPGGGGSRDSYHNGADAQGTFCPATIHPSQEKCPPTSSEPKENVLIQDIGEEISEAAAYVQGGVVEDSVQADVRPLDSNLICPLCKKQFRIGQIQHYRQHVDSCNGMQ